MGVLSDRQIEAEGIVHPFLPQQHRPGIISYGCTSYGYDVRLGYKFKVFQPYSATVIDPKNFDQRCLIDVDLTPEHHDWCRMRVPSSKEFSDYDLCSFCGKEEHKDEHGYEQGRDNTCSKSKPNHIDIPPHSFALGESIEKFTIPRDMTCIVVGKSTYARCGLIVNVTPGEPEWEGHWTIELSNTTPLPLRVYAGEGIMQCVFIRADGAVQADIDHLRIMAIGESYWGKCDADEVAAARRSGTCKVSYKDKKGRYQGQGGLTLPFVSG